MSLKTLSVLIFLTVGFSIISTPVSVSAQSEVERSSVSINPSCAPAISDPFEVSMKGNGFKSNTDVGWKLEAFDKSVPYYGYFETDVNGAFKGKTLFEDLGAGNYKIHFGENVDGYGMFTGEPKVTLSLAVPCSNEQEIKTTATIPKSKKSYQLIVYLDDASSQNVIGDKSGGEQSSSWTGTSLPLSRPTAASSRTHCE